MGWLSGFNNRLPFAIDHDYIDSDLADCTLMLVISASCGQTNADNSCFFDKLGSDANRKKIAATTSDGETQCYVEIVYFSYANELALLKVKLSPTAASDATGYLYYDPDQSDNTDYVGDIGDTAAKSAHRTECELIAHSAHADESTSFSDGSKNTHTVTPNGNTHHETDQPIIGPSSIDFDGTGDFLGLATSTYQSWAFGTGDFMVSTWIYISNTPALYDRIASYRSASAYNPGWQFLFESDTKVSFFVVDTTYAWDSISSLLDGLHRLTVMRISGTLYLLVDGVAHGTTHACTKNASGSSAFPLEIGRNPYNGGENYYDGYLNEFQVFNGYASQAWDKAQYYADSDNLITWSAEETTDVTVTAVPLEMSMALASGANFQHCFHGYVTEQGSPVARTVRLYARSDGSLKDSTASDSGTGYYLLSGEASDMDANLIAFDDSGGEDYDDMLLSKVTPNLVRLTNS